MPPDVAIPSEDELEESAHTCVSRLRVSLFGLHFTTEAKVLLKDLGLSGSQHRHVATHMGATRSSSAS